MRLLSRYAHWLHMRWPAGRVEPLPVVNRDGTTNIPGVYIVGDLQGVPLLKFALHSGATAVRAILSDAAFLAGRAKPDPHVVDVAVIGGGVAGMAAALEAVQNGLSHVVIESSGPFSTIVNFPARKPIFTYPLDMTPAGDLTVTEKTKEPLVEELERQTQGRLNLRPAHAERIVKRGDNLEVVLRDGTAIVARRVIVAIGRSGNYRKLGVPGEELGKVSNRLHDPRDFSGRHCLVVGGGDSALEAAVALAEAGATVTLSYRGAAFSRAKPENVEAVHRLAAEHRLALRLPTVVRRIDADSVTLADGEVLGNDAVFTMIGREAPLDFFRRSGIRIRGEWRMPRVATLIASLAFFTFLYHWKKTGLGGFENLPLLRDVARLGELFQTRMWFPHNVPALLGQPASALARTLSVTLGEPGFYYSLAYCLVIVFFGMRRIRRRRTPYVAVQTWTLAAIQIIPLFLLPYIVLPWMGHAGMFDHGPLRAVADALFPVAGYGHGREYWRAFGLVLAWPLFFWNVFTGQPMWWWLLISFIQTFVLIPLIVFRWGKGAYCGWICSCGALAETLGDAHRDKMPHGPGANRLNMAGQVILVLCFALLGLRILEWSGVAWAGRAFAWLFHDAPLFNFVWFVDLFLAGIVGVGLYFNFSGRVWCRFFCPLAALMHVYTRFGVFAIIPEKKKCISCNVCTSVCHMGIDVMNFANKGLPMRDPQCVRCSACVQGCPTGVLRFGQVDRGGRVIRIDALRADDAGAGR